jgi:hypothetical protein
MSAMMSDMTTFTVRDLDRTPSRVLDACDREGEVLIRRRNGQTYRVLSPKGAASTRPAKYPDFEARKKLIFGDLQYTDEQWAYFSKQIAGE